MIDSDIIIIIIINIVVAAIVVVGAGGAGGGGCGGGHCVFDSYHFFPFTIFFSVQCLELFLFNTASAASFYIELFIMPDCACVPAHRGVSVWFRVKLDRD